jgi:MoxR-like ATPase
MTDFAISYGATLDAESITRTLGHIFRTNLAHEEGPQGKRPTPICIWGTHGIGKTAVVKAFAHDNGWKFRYCAPAQFEEMGDLHGLPVKLEANPETAQQAATVYMPPEWVPRPDDVGPGILLLDDINRADERILRGLMQLLQEFEMFSWTLPPKWQIVCTANPEGSDYSVTPMDDAMLTRLLHMTMVFDLKAWARWALDNGVDSRGVSFVLTYPEVITGKRTTPRTLTQFFDQIQNIRDLRQELELVNILAQSALEDVTASAFLAFVNDHLEQLLEPGDILDAPDWEPVARRMQQLFAGSGDSKRIDRIATICTRLFLELSSANYQSKPAHAANLVRFLQQSELPNDLRFSLHRDLTALGGEIARMVRDPQLSKLLLGSL